MTKRCCYIFKLTEYLMQNKQDIIKKISNIVMDLVFFHQKSQWLMLLSLKRVSFFFTLLTRKCCEKEETCDGQ